MTKKLKLFSSLLFNFCFFTTLPSLVQAWDYSEGDTATLKDIELLFAQILGTITSLAGITSFIMLIVGGFKLLTSAGDPEKIKSASATITWAITGLVLIIGAWFILKFIAEFTGLEKITIFKIFTLPIN